MQLQSTKSAERVKWVDIFKGICISLMVFGHASAPFITYIYLFHMPAFIIISGYTYHETGTSIILFIKKKIITLLLPYFLINIVFILIYGALSYGGLYTPTLLYNEINYSILNRIFWLFKSFVTPDLGGATWFLPVLFWAEIFFKIVESISQFLLSHIDYYKNLKNTKFLFGILLGLIGWYMIRNSMASPYLLDLGLFACLFYTVGVYCKEKKILETSVDNKCYAILSIIVCIFFGSFFFKGILPMNWPSRMFSNLFIQLLSCFCATFLCYLISRYFETIKSLSLVISYIGQRTYSILILHFFAFKLLFIFLIAIGVLQPEYFDKLVPDPYLGIQWLLFGGSALSICLFISKVSEFSVATNYLVNVKGKRRINCGQK